MFRHRKHLNHEHTEEAEEPEDKKQIAKVTKRWLSLLISILTAILAFLSFRIGELWWPAWLSDCRGIFIGVILVILIFSTFMAPVIIEATSDPRPLSGPGKRPMGY
jgi:predicted RND superfamily exporter protein